MTSACRKQCCAYNAGMAKHTQQENERTYALTILGIGTAVSLASLIGGLWIVRAGVVVAILMAFAATWMAYSQLRREREAHRAEISREVIARKELVSKHHEDSMAMLDRFTRRHHTQQTQLASVRRQLGAAKAELATMRGNSAWLRGELAERQARIQQLTEQVAALEASLAEVTSAPDEAESLVIMPRRGAASLSPSAHDIWADDEHPTMVDLSSVQLDVALGDQRRLA